ncbi:hypothetical protein BGW36DRAFT_405365 [Talaromyces proteolyticus]|uniref:CRIB domain-containing protein n=1 Tax=Talaromyces proteolyticus TaxID=1131652 RepID=A0AAD4L3N6_9EURO|nr:uncharacterized protein BGW36DRAFT_405365 [Talaromyces proteolyticus]KAH8702614.1 hypothetical protein BGW36DRAFT_405365 [Talaromyces proteolyticus]
MASQPGVSPLESPWQDDFEFRQRPPTSSTSDHSEHSFHIRSKSSANVHSPKRLSVFGRSRSNTTTSITSPRRSPTSPNSGEVPMPLLHDEKPAPTDSVARSLLVRGSRILRRQGSKLNVAPTLDEEDEAGKTSKFEVSSIFQRNHRMKRSESHEQLKRVISEPYNFHHVIHTSSNQFHALDSTSNNELVGEFSAIQASQTPEPGLKGIRVQDLDSNNTSTENVSESMTEEDRNQAASPAMSPPTSPRSPGKIENFSRPPTSQAMDEFLGLIDHRHSYLDERIARQAASLEDPGMFHPDIGYATHGHQNEDDAHLTAAVINSYLSDLEDVPEEEDIEEHEANENSQFEPLPPRRSSSVYDEVESSPPPPVPPKSAARHESVIVVQDTELSFSEDLMSPTLPQFRPILQDSPMSQASDVKAGNPAGGFEEFSTSWDEDIDYCYEHAAEADCDFDWNRSSIDIPGRSVVGALPSEKASTRLTVHDSRNATSVPATPDLDPGSARSIMTRSHEAITPLSEGAAPAGFFHAKPQPQEYFKLQTGDVGNDPVYEDYLAVQDDVEGQLRYYPQPRSHSVDLPVSPRSSYSPISKCNSQESVMLSRAASIVRKHRSSTSTTSVPELVPSAGSSSRETATRESIGSFEQSTPTSIPEPPRAGFSYHRQVKSLAPEIGSFSNLRSTRSNGSIDVIVDLPYPSATPTHDRTKSTSAVDHQKNKTKRPEDLPSPRPISVAQKRKSRVGYSLFPSAMTAPQR